MSPKKKLNKQDDTKTTEQEYQNQSTDAEEINIDDEYAGVDEKGHEIDDEIHPIHPVGSEHHEILDDENELKAVTASKDNQIVLNTVVGAVAYVILIFALYLFWTGHNAPGGGFIAGLMTSAVVVLLYVSYGSAFIKNILKFDFKYLIAIGLSISLGCGIGGIIVGEPFLTHTFVEFHSQIFGEIEFATATIFDLGVYLTVTGGCVTIITSMGESGGKRASAIEKTSDKTHGE